MSKKRICGVSSSTKFELLLVYCFVVLILSLSFHFCHPGIMQPYQVQNLKSSKDMPKIAIPGKNKLKINTYLSVYIPPVLDLKNCVATSVVLTTATCIYVKPGLKLAKYAGKKHFPNCFPSEHKKPRLALVDVVCL